MHALEWWRITGLLMIFVVVAVSGLPAASAETRPLGRLPLDLARWSMVWAYVPQQMYAVALDNGPVAGLTWGSAKGTALMVGSTGKALWDAVQPDERPGHSDEGDISGPIFRYEF